MTLPQNRRANAPAVRFQYEAFTEVAHNELAAYPLVEPGVCMNPMCSRHFAPTRSWQRYCSKQCRDMDHEEMRMIGQKAAPALLAHRLGKYETKNAALRALSKAGRNYTSGLVSEWYRDRLRRVAERGQNV